MIGILGLHGSSQHPELISEFTNRLAPQQPGCSPRGIFVDGEGFSFFKRRSDRSIPHEELMALARESLSATGFVLACGLKDMLVVGYSSGALFGTALLALAPFSKRHRLFRSSDQQWMVNFRVDDLDWLVASLTASGIALETRNEWNSEAGRFARIHDPEGNPVELWEPAQD